MNAYIESQKAEKLTAFWSEIDKIARGPRNAQSTIFAQRAKDVISSAYAAEVESGKRTGRWIARIGVDSTSADRLVEMGKTEAVYGRGRTLLRK